MNKKDEIQLVPKLRFPEFKKSGKWEVKKLGDVTYKIIQKNREGKIYPIYSINNKIGFVPQSEQFEGLDSNKRDYDITLYNIINKNTFAYNPSRINVGSIGYSGELDNVIISSLYVCFKTTSDVRDNFFLHILNSFSFNESVKNNVEGGIRNYLFYENFSRIKLPFPSLSEQQKIADCLSSLDECISAETRKLESLRLHKKGLMQNLFPAEGESVPKLRFPEFKKSGKWEEKKLGDVCVNIASGKDKNTTNGIYDLYGSTEIIGKTLDYSYDGKFLLVARVGANAGYINKVEGKFGVTDNTLVITLDKEKHINFLYYLLLKNDLNKLVFGSGQPLITGGLLKLLSLSIPSLPEQQKIADCLSSLDECISSQSQKIASLKLHKKGLMQNLFPSMEDRN